MTDMIEKILNSVEKSSYERPLLIPFIALISGLTLSIHFNYSVTLQTVISCFLLLIASVFLRPRLPFVICVALLILTWGLYCTTSWQRPMTLPDYAAAFLTPRTVILEGVVDSRPAARQKDSGLTTSFVLDLEGVVEERRFTPQQGRVLVTVNGEFAHDRGDRVRLMAVVRVPQPLGLPGEFDYQRHLAYQDIHAVAYARSPQLVLLMRLGAHDSIQRRADIMARRLGEFIRSSIADQRLSSIVSALIIGDQKRIPSDLADAYSRAGVVHILSISGFHISIIALFASQALLMLLTRVEYLALRFNLRRSVLLLSLPLMLGYLLLTGAAPATVRSVLMLCLFVAVLYAEREPDPVNALLLSALLMVLVYPQSVFDVSFQLSFLALWGIVLMVPPVAERLRHVKHRWISAVLILLTTSCAATIATAVPVLYHFGQTSLNGILANFLIVPLLGYVAVLAGFCALPFVVLLPPLAHLLFWLTAKVVLLSNWIIGMFAKLPQIIFYGVSELDFALLLLLMLALTLLGSFRKKLVMALIMVVSATAVHWLTAVKADGRLHLTMLSVGQAESMLLRFPDGSNMLVDGGGYLYDNGLDFGERLLAPALYKMGVKHIDTMLVTHCHPDHIGGLPYLARNMRVGRLMIGPDPAGAEYDKLISALSVQGTKIVTISAGDSLPLADGVDMQVYAPEKPLGNRVKRPADTDLNEQSLVFRVRHGRNGIIFTGDAGAESESNILGQNVPLEANLLKVGHHGSRNSTTEPFLKKVAPQYALISAGRDNRFGLPAPETVEQLKQHGVKVYRTDVSGSIEMVSDGSSWQVKTPYSHLLRSQ